MTTVVSWNMHYRREPWRELARMDADVALLQETCKVPSEVADRIEIGPPGHSDRDVLDSRLWDSDLHKDYFRGRRWPRIAKLSDRVEVKWFEPVLTVLGDLSKEQIRVSDLNSITAAEVIPRAGVGESFVVVSMYAAWIPPHPITGRGWSHAAPDVSAHRIISDLSAFIGHAERPHRILAAGDLNMDYGDWDFHTARNRPLQGARIRTVWDRLKALGFEYLGPRFPNGRREDPALSDVPADSPSVPTFHSAQSSPASADIQDDHVFASRGFHETIKTRALNEVHEWGSSDHCRLVIEVGANGVRR